MFNPILISGMVLVNIALLFYTLGIRFELKFKSAADTVLAFFSIGLLFDITSTTLMIIGSRHIPITPHGFLGYSALTVMIVENALLWQFRLRNGTKSGLSRLLQNYSIIAYSWWVLAYIAGASLVFLKVKI